MDSNKLLEERQSIHVSIRKNKKNYQLNNMRMKNMMKLKGPAAESHIKYYGQMIQNYVNEENKQKGIDLTLALFEDKQQDILSCALQYVDDLFELCKICYPSLNSIKLTRWLVNMCKDGDVIKHQVIKTIVNMIRSYSSNESIIRQCLQVLIKVASEHQQNPDFELIKDLCLNIYGTWKNQRQLFYLISFMTKHSNQYFPQSQIILNGTIQQFGLLEQQPKIIAFDIISHFIQNYPYLVQKNLKIVIQICLIMAKSKEFYTQSSAYYRKHAIKCLTILLQQFQYKATKQFLSKNVIIEIICMIRMQNVLIKNICFKVLQTFCKYCDTDQILELMMKYTSFVDFLQLQGLGTSNFNLQYPTLLIISYCLSKFTTGHQNTFKNLIDNQIAGFVDILEDFTFNKEDQIAQLATQIIEKYYTFVDEHSGSI